MSLLTMTRGDTATFTITLTDGDGDALDLDDVTNLRFTVKRSVFDSDDDAIIAKELGDGIAVLDPDDGTARITIDPDDTEDLEVSGPSLRWDLQVEGQAGDVRTPLRGRLVIIPDTTRTAA